MGNAPTPCLFGGWCWALHKEGQIPPSGMEMGGGIPPPEPPPLPDDETMMTKYHRPKLANLDNF